jgi:hypothetical protein
MFTFYQQHTLGSPAPAARGRGSIGRAALACLAIAWQSTGGLGATHAAPTTTGDIAGIWQVTRYVEHLTPIDGGSIPFTPAGLARYESIEKQLQENPATDAAQTSCVPQGVPRSLASPYPFSIVQSEHQTVIVHEVNREFRIVLLQPQHNDPGLWDPSYMGDGIGSWDHGVFVIDSTNFLDSTWLDDSGVPHSDQLHTVERLRTVDSGRRLEDVVTIEDAKTFTRPWTVRLLFDRRPRVFLTTDWVCGESHRDVSSVPGAKSYR